MRYANRLVLLAVVAAVVMALAAPSASAIEPITVVNEAGTANYPSIRMQQNFHVISSRKKSMVASSRLMLTSVSNRSKS